MATWTLAKKYTYDGRNLNGGTGSIPVYVELLYDKDSLTTTSVKVKFIGYTLNSSNKKANGYYNIYTILYDPNGTNEKNILLKKHTKSGSAFAWLTDTYQFTLTKTAASTSFTLKEFWMCCCGAVYPKEMDNGAIVGVEGKTKIVYDKTYDFYTLFNVGRAAWCDKKEKSNTNIFSGIFSGPTPGATATNFTIKDNGNNTAQISGTLGNPGTGNARKSATVYYTLDGSTAPTPGASGVSSKNLDNSNNSYSYSQAASSAIVNNAKTTGKFIVKAKTRCVFDYNTADTSVVSEEVKYYVAPSSIPEAPKISYNKSRLTIKEPWKFSWKAATEANASSGVKGYRLRLYKNGTNIPIKSSNGTVLSKLNGSSTTDYCYDTESTGTSITIDPVVHEFKATDTVQLGVYAYTKNGEKTPKQLFSATQVWSDEYEVKNAGIVQVNTGSGHVEGQVYVRVAKEGSFEWKEAETVNVCTPSSTGTGFEWKESQ